MGIDANILIYLGVAGLVVSGLWKYAPRLAELLPSRQPATSDLAKITASYAVLFAALAANGSAAAADRLRTEILPEAVKPTPEEPTT